ncbi:MAG: ribulose-phosphate 3-epimerase [Gemmatimonadetes bacterium]|nr:ribulose-phosphate 3-epimerase [Gemmatimonadota bacterium]
MSAPNVRISASLLSADFADLGAEVRAAEEAGCDEIHFDVMDGRFVPNLTIGAPVLAAVRRRTRLPISVHMMVVDAAALLEDFAAAGASSYTVHVEACTHLHAALEAIRRCGLRAGVALNPATPPSAIEEALPYADRVLVMTVNPGFGGQQFIPGTLRKIERLRRMLDDARLDVELAVDGGINVDTAPGVVRAGARTLIAGSAIFGHPGGIAAGVRAVREAAASATP